MKKEIKKQIRESIGTKERLQETSLEDIAEAAQKIINAFKEGHKVLLCGNGGSAADAQHIAAEFVGKFLKERSPLPAIALTTDTSILTSLSNDYDYKLAFSRQIQALGEKGDILIAISTSGKSPSVIEAVKAAAKRGIFTIGLTGRDGSKLKDVVGLAIVVPSHETPRIQEAHILIGHILCDMAERALFK